MANVYPFRPLQFLGGVGDASPFVAPPYDVLDAAAKDSLLHKDPRNIVAIDLPHTPAKELGPQAVYDAAAASLRRLIDEGTLSHRLTPAMYAYQQTTRTPSGVSRRRGMAVTVDAVPFGPRPGGGVLPHEETFSGPKEDRMALMRATRTQLSPIFGLHPDASGAATRQIEQMIARRTPDMTAQTADGVLHEVWTVESPSDIAAYQNALADEDIFIADGHHRYTTQLNYIRELEALGACPPDHPARRCLMVLVSMSDPGLAIWPTHRVLGGMRGYSFDAFLKASSPHLTIHNVSGGLDGVGTALRSRTELGPMRLGLFDFATGRGALATPTHPDPLAHLFPDKPLAWRTLSVAYLQYILVEEVCQKALNAGHPVKWAFPHSLAEVRDIGEGRETGAGGGTGFAQLAVLVLPTPLEAVREVSRAGHLMPQKSTFFYPKLATGLFMNPLE
ncbi:MAG: DUF1015 domain-containing protein [Phycisphaeraceae bacterium]|nr:DUF1015 domain-containing protein [Phycisphaeraceae bacterium]